jgi:hypothetical protein
MDRSHRLHCLPESKKNRSEVIFPRLQFAEPWPQKRGCCPNLRCQDIVFVQPLTSPDSSYSTQTNNQSNYRPDHHNLDDHELDISPQSSTFKLLDRISRFYPSCRCSCAFSGRPAVVTVFSDHHLRLETHILYVNGHFSPPEEFCINDRDCPRENGVGL